MLIYADEISKQYCGVGTVTGLRRSTADLNPSGDMYITYILYYTVLFGPECLKFTCSFLTEGQI